MNKNPSILHFYFLFNSKDIDKLKEEQERLKRRQAELEQLRNKHAEHLAKTKPKNFQPEQSLIDEYEENNLLMEEIINKKGIPQLFQPTIKTF